MRVAVVTESFLPNINGVTNSVLRVLEHLSASGDQALVIAPASENMPTEYAGHPVKAVPVIPTQNFLPTGMPLGLPQKRIQHLLDGFSPDVIHLASPFALGSYANKMAKKLDIPTVSIYQTDLGGFAKQYGFGIAQSSLQKILYKIHSQTDRTLAPSTSACLDLHLAGVPEVYLWRRGVNTELFNPNKRSATLRDTWKNGDQSKIIVGFVGRLAQEKRVSDLKALQSNPNIQLVIVGDGPHRHKLEQQLPGALFLGFKGGEELAQIYASFDLFIHPGPNETFCQAVQEALASGIPSIVPRTGGPADLVAHGRTGYVIDIFNAVQLNQTVNLHHERTDRKQMRIAARDSVSMRTWNRINNELKAHYQDVINQKKSTKISEIGVA
ncbi:MAG: glycosyltransferase family 1 protein [Actinomycetes bacterium]